LIDRQQIIEIGMGLGEAATAVGLGIERPEVVLHRQRAPAELVPVAFVHGNVDQQVDLAFGNRSLAPHRRDGGRVLARGWDVREDEPAQQGCPLAHHDPRGNGVSQHAPVGIAFAQGLVARVDANVPCLHAAVNQGTAHLCNDRRPRRVGTDLVDLDGGPQGAGIARDIEERPPGKGRLIEARKRHGQAIHHCIDGSRRDKPVLRLRIAGELRSRRVHPASTPADPCHGRTGCTLADELATRKLVLTC